MSLPPRRSFPSGGRTIAVDVFPAAGREGPAPAILMLHGADGPHGHAQYRAAAEATAAAGYHVFFVHYLDRTGERRASFATVFGNFVPWTETVRDALDWVVRQDDVDPERIGLLGVSLGAALGLAVAAEDRRIRALVDLFGPLPQGAVTARTRLPPTLILHGAADPVVPVSNALAVEAILKDQGIPYEIQVYPGQGHSFYGAAQRDATARILAFLDRHLGGEPGGRAAPLPSSVRAG